MRRRNFIALLGGAGAWPLAARAQQAMNPVVGFLSGRSPVEALGVVAAFRKGLSESGFVEPQNVTIDFRWAEGQFDRLPALARELVDRPVAVVAALGGSDTAAKSATTTIPIVFGTGGDPVANGFLLAEISSMPAKTELEKFDRVLAQRFRSILIAFNRGTSSGARLRGAQ
jgi:putative ABC transport system substrate-binding protein